MKKIAFCVISTNNSYVYKAIITLLSIKKNNISFDENFGFSKFIPGEENIFLKDCLNKKLNMKHINKAILFHSNKSTGTIYKDSLIISRIEVFKRLFGFFGKVFAVFYFTFFKYKEYKSKYSLAKYFWISFKEVFRK